MNRIAKRNRKADQCEKLLYALISLLVFEGILRKILPPLATPIFFLKDILCIYGVFLIANLSLPGTTARLNAIWKLLIYLFIPLLIYTAFKDAILAVFAFKQYLLYVVTALLVGVAFPGNKAENFKKFIYFTALLIIPTAIVAILQNALPSSHWLNLSVGGENLEAFSAGGFLRVGSTFSFTAQYSWFLVAECFFLAASFFMQPRIKNGHIRKIVPLTYAGMLLLLVISAFITGGRTAVIGCGATLALGFVFIGFRTPSWFLRRGLPILFLGIIGLVVLRGVKPEFFLAYDARSAGTEEVTHNEEVTHRVVSGFIDWTDWFWQQNALQILFGNGLGVMSNGAQQVSSYASLIRSDGFWTEGDVPTTFWEGGIYLAVIWYGFRLSLIFLCFRLWRSIKTTKLSSAAAVPLAYVVVSGVNSTLGMHPPLSIWWWFGIGIVFFISRFDKYKRGVITLLPAQQHEKADHFY